MVARKFAESRMSLPSRGAWIEIGITPKGKADKPDVAPLAGSVD